jgi:lipopolysaccharide transport system ATP-binding protein
VAVTQVVIHAEGLGKRYNRGLSRTTGLLRDTLARALRSPLSVFRVAKEESYWALRDISLQVQEGEVFGLIGRNGSGKSTLLKILSRITTPTSGWAEIHGRVGTLLEVGTGFHPELTGRENTFLSGAILGMKRREIARKFEEIVSFAEMEKFIDTPVKHYSSGMYVRLAFAVAAHLETEILFVDEVLAVGDIRFQEKCLGKMSDVASSGRTVILVSHQLNQIRRLCNRVMWLDSGVSRQIGPTAEVVNSYEVISRGDKFSERSRDPRSSAQFFRWAIAGTSAEKQHNLEAICPTTVCFSVHVYRPLSNVHHGIALYNQARQVIWGNAFDGLSLGVGSHKLQWTLPYLPLRPGAYSWRVSLYDKGERIDDWDCDPPLYVSTQPLTHKQDEFAGVLNIAGEFGTLDIQDTI